MAPEERFKAPGTELFDLPPLWDGAPEWLNKPALLAVGGALLVCAVVWRAFARPRLVPRGLQNAVEYGYVFVRDQVARPFLGKDADRWMPLLFSLFLLILVWNFMGVVPLLQFPVNSHSDFPWVLAGVVYVVKLHQGFKHQGFAGFFRRAMFPPGLPRALAITVYAPLELLYIFVTAPFTHGVRLFANMFAGHMLLAFFSAVGYWFMIEQPTVPGFGVGVLGVLMTILMTAFEMFIMFLQAYLFTMLAAMYIGQSVHPEH
ncbi:F0F1 ATP synthase subunit A [Nonomuraea zeae]|uniref:ATP synthase subunit a n=1 Tax=Nonomuraea zeae TaxID=1642303 RepID=A0A5S4GVT9_9ACTN|nr:F0F1 ATP synthase subunit A [Nonomuraea zeae]TMR36842.1 F0F1 ATP synthase subunit A [Nonomuraea zeae]